MCFLLFSFQRVLWVLEVHGTLPRPRAARLARAHGPLGASARATHNQHHAHNRTSATATNTTNASTAAFSKTETAATASVRGVVLRVDVHALGIGVDQVLVQRLQRDLPQLRKHVQAQTQFSRNCRETH
jgi:hypothetical protein